MLLPWTLDAFAVDRPDAVGFKGVKGFKGARSPVKSDDERRRPPQHEGQTAAAPAAPDSGSAAAATRLPVQLCACDPAHAAAQTWTWGKMGVQSQSRVVATALAPLRMKADPSMCHFNGLSAKQLTQEDPQSTMSLAIAAARVVALPTNSRFRVFRYLYVDKCASGRPALLNFRTEKNPGLQRDSSVLTTAGDPLS